MEVKANANGVAASFKTVNEKIKNTGDSTAKTFKTMTKTMQANKQAFEDFKKEGWKMSEDCVWMSFTQPWPRVYNQHKKTSQSCPSNRPFMRGFEIDSTTTINMHGNPLRNERRLCVDVLYATM